MKGFNAVMTRRIEACAVIVADEKADKVQSIIEYVEETENRAISVEEASSRYVIGALRQLVRKQIVRTYEEALDRFENEQIGDRERGFTMESSVSREVRRINAINNAGNVKLPVKVTAPHTRNMAKVYGSLYVQWIDSEESQAVEAVLDAQEYDAMALHMEEHIKAYINEYIGRLSTSGVKAIHELCASRYTVRQIMTAKNGEEKALRNKIEYIHRSFPARDSVSARELARILIKYVA